MQCAPDVTNTSQLPHTYKMLNEMLPTVFKSRCFNEQNYPFSVEVKKTEMAHLFEHIMLEYICQAMIANGESKVSVSGVTDWNWKRDPIGTFHITLHVGRNNHKAFTPAFEKSVKFFRTLVDQQAFPYEKQTD